MSEAPHPIPTVAVREYPVGPEISEVPPLAHDEIHVWHQGLCQEAAEVDAFRGLLSSDELQRAARFRFDKDRSEFMVSRGTLRRLLGCYLQIPPKELGFAYSEYGRPGLVGDAPPTMLDFNVSHSGGVALL